MPQEFTDASAVIATSFDDALPEYDICVVGSGPAGLAVALECARNGRSVLLLEAGGSIPSRKEASPFLDRIEDERSHVPLRTATRRTFGGTSWVWGGLCVPLEAIDFEARPFVPMSGWPIGPQDVARWHRAAARFLGCGDADFITDELLDDPASQLRTAMTGRIPLQPNLAVAYRADIRHSPNIFCCLHANVIDLHISADGCRVERLRISSDRPMGAPPKAAVYVLAAGGIETTRILLATQRRHPALSGGAGGPLGRFYMGHLAGQLATLVFRDAKMAEEFLFRRTDDGAILQRRFAISASAQRRHELLNTGFVLRLPPAADCRHLSGALSLLHMALRTPRAGRAMARSLKLQAVLPTFERTNAKGHIRNILMRPSGTLADAARLVRGARFGILPSCFQIPATATPCGTTPSKCLTPIAGSPSGRNRVSGKAGTFRSISDTARSTCPRSFAPTRSSTGRYARRGSATWTTTFRKRIGTRR